MGFSAFQFHPRLSALLGKTAAWTVAVGPFSQTRADTGLLISDLSRRLSDISPERQRMRSVRTTDEQRTKNECELVVERTCTNNDEPGYKLHCRHLARAHANTPIVILACSHRGACRGHGRGAVTVTSTAISTRTCAGAGAGASAGAR